jgi:hypothetical protein
MEGFEKCGRAGAWRQSVIEGDSAIDFEHSILIKRSIALLMD